MLATLTPQSAVHRLSKFAATPAASGDMATESSETQVDTFVPSAEGVLCGCDKQARRQELGLILWERYQEGRIDLYPVQVSGRNDGADARSNIADTAMGRTVKRSSYGNAPGGRVALALPLLEGLKELSEDFTFRLTALAGGSHSKRSRHYLGVSLDIDTLDGVRLSSQHPRFQEFMTKVRALGATEVLGPGDRGHNSHIHAAWPRDAASPA